MLDQEEHHRHHLVVSLSGAHAYGFPSPDSDLDLKAIHIEPTARLLALSPPAASAAREMEELRPIVHRALSRRVYRHYHGFATGQLHEFEAAEGAPVKKILYVLRTTLTGTHLLRTSEVQTDVTKLLDSYGFADAHELVAAKLAGERVYLAASLKGRWMEAVKRAFAMLDEAHAQSPLPPDSLNRDEVEAWLVEARRRAW